MNTTKNLYAFTLGREWKVSLAELFALWGTDAYQSHTETVAIFQILGYSTEQLQRKFLNIGGSIRLIEILGDTTTASFPTDVIEFMNRQKGTGKIDFALGAYGVEFRLSDIGLRIKKTMQDAGSSIRLVNVKNENINAASFKKEKLAKTGYEYSIIQMMGDCFIGRTLACQDIDSYAKRDTAKSRDMITGMMPPKLVQMMINIATAGENLANKSNPVSIYDPFCGLGTTLIEAANMGITRVYGSDLSPEMVRSTEESLAEYIAEERVWQERILKVGGTPNKDFSNFQSKVLQLDARDISTAKNKLEIPTIPFSNLTIVSEGYLGEIMHASQITLDKAKEERRKLSRMYDEFFGGLAKLVRESSQKQEIRGRENLSKGTYSGVSDREKSLSDKEVGSFSELSIVMTFPFWNLNGTYSYFIEIYDIIEKHGFEVVSLLPWEMKLNTMKGSLLYRRENQTVGREIIKIVPKK